MDGLIEGRNLDEEWINEYSLPKSLNNNTLDLSYIAGLIDGEGYIGVVKAENQGKYYPRFSLQVVITIRQGYILEQLCNIFGGYVSKEEKSLQNDNWSDVYRWKISTNKALVFLQSIYPYLRIKKQQAFFAIHFQLQMTKRKGGRRSENIALIQQDHYWLLRNLNKTGDTKKIA